MSLGNYSPITCCNDSSLEKNALAPVIQVVLAM